MLIKLTYLIKKYNLDIIGVSHFGAHLGQEVSVYKELNIKNIHLFEPQKNLYSVLEEKFSNDSDISLYNFGLGDEEKSEKLNLSPENNGLSASILKPQKHKDLYPDIKFIGTEEVAIKIYDKLKIEKVNFLNIDIQGYELFALKGSLETLRKDIDYIFIEVNKEEFYQGNVLVNELDEFLEKLGFIRVETKWVNRFIQWGDALYIKKDNLNKQTIYKAKITKFLESFYFYYLFIDLFRLFYRLKYKTKQYLKNFISGK